MVDGDCHLPSSPLTLMGEILILRIFCPVFNDYIYIFFVVHVFPVCRPIKCTCIFNFGDAYVHVCG